MYIIVDDSANTADGVSIIYENECKLQEKQMPLGKNEQAK